MPEYKNLLLAIDFSTASDGVAKRAADIAQRYNSRLTLLHVVEFLPPLNIGDEPIPSPGWVVEEEVLVKNAENSLARFTRNLGLAEAARLVTVGVPKYEIVRIAKEKNMDLIVMGSHGRHGISRLLGSTASSVLNNTPCDVLAVRIK